MPPDTTEREREPLPRLGILALVALLLATAAAAVLANRLLVHERATADRQRAAASAARVTSAVTRSVRATQGLQTLTEAAPNDVAAFERIARATVGLADSRAQAVRVAGVEPAKTAGFTIHHPGLSIESLPSHPTDSGGRLVFATIAVSGSGPMRGPGADAGADPALLNGLVDSQFRLVVSPVSKGRTGPGVWLTEATTRPPDAESDAGYVAAFFPTSALLGPDAAYSTLLVGGRQVDRGVRLRDPIRRSARIGGEPWTVLVARRPLSLPAKLAPAGVVVFGVILMLLVWLALGRVVRRHQTALTLERRRGERRVLAERAAEEERRRIARELHDSISQGLFSMSLQVRTASVALEREGVDPRSPLARAVGELARLTRGALAEIRALIFELRPEGLREEGLLAALRKHAAAVAARAGVPVEADLPETPLPLDPSIEEELYRVAQEAIHNAVRHADATKISVAAGQDPQRGIWLEVSDDGRGFDPGVERPGHLGLRNMAERAARAGGDLSIDSAPGAGTRVRLSLPLVTA